MIAALREARGRGGRPSRDEVPIRNERLLAIAADAFVAQGYDATTIEGIAATAGVAKRTIYSRYPNKKALLFAVVRRLTERQPLDEIAFDAATSFESGLRQLARAMIEISMEPNSIALQRLVLNELKTFPELGQEQWQFVEREHGGRIAAYFRAQKTRAGLRDVDPVKFADMFMRSVFSFVNNVIILRYAIPTGREIDDFLDTLIDVLMNGVRK